MTRDDSQRAGGFTLVELLVVMALLSLLAVALIQGLGESREIAYRTIDRTNLEFHYKMLAAHLSRHGRYPKQHGHGFVLAPWVNGIARKTPENRDRYFSPTQSQDPHWITLKEQDYEQIWRRFGDLSSRDTSYAGRGRQHWAKIHRPNQALIATDNEFGNHYSDGTVLVLVNSGVVRQVLPDPGWDGISDIPVGPRSSHRLLATLEK